MAEGGTNRSGEMPDAVLRLLSTGREEGFLASHHAEAARLITRVFERASLRQRTTMSYDPARIGRGGPGRGQADIADSAAEARQRLARLAAAIPHDCWGVLTDICVYDKGLQQIEAERHWPRRSAKLVLRIGLDHLSNVLGFDARAQGRDGHRVETWLPERPPMFTDPGH